MIKISIIQDGDKNIKGFLIKGHAGYDEIGRDIVCSAVSAVAYTGIAALLNLAGGCDYSDKSGNMKCFLKDISSEEDFKTAQIILKSIQIGFMQIEQSNSKYVRVREEEV